MKRTLPAVALLALLALPRLFPDAYVVHVMIVVFVFAILAAGLDVVMGYCGQFSFGQAAFYGIGAYTSAILARDLGAPFWATLPSSTIVAAAFGALLGLPAVRLAGHFLAITTIAFQVIVTLVLTQWHGFTGGTAGITGIPSPSEIRVLGRTWLALDSPAGYYYLSLFVALIVVTIAHRFSATRLGQEWLAVREDETLAKTLGLNTTRVKLLAFTLSAGLAGAAGSLIAHYLRNVHPSEFTIWTSAEIVAMVILGGRGTLWGPILGTLILTLLPESLRFAKDYKLVLFGVTLIVMTAFLPDGLLGGWRRIRDRAAHT